jgi:hypothetical protein
LPEHRRSTVNILLRLLPEEAETLQRAAGALGLTRTQLLRLLCRHAMFMTVSVVPPEPTLPLHVALACDQERNVPGSSGILEASEKAEA